MIRKLDLDKKPTLTALIVGGSGGIGLAIAKKLSSRGINLILHGKNEEKLAGLQRALQAEVSVSVTTLCLEISSGCDSEKLLSAARNADLLVYALGSFLYKPLAQTDSEEWSEIVHSNLILPGYLAAQSAKAMAGRGFGRILLFGGTRTDAIRGFKQNAVYASAKTGLAVLTKSIAAEFSSRGVACAMLCPGFVETEYLSPDFLQELKDKSPSKELIQPSEIAELACQLLEGTMDLCNGSIITADGGLYSL